jgi:Calcineurin-like phosphoesterase
MVRPCILWWLASAGIILPGVAANAAFSGSLVLGRPTAHTIVVNALSASNAVAYIEFGLAPGVYSWQTGATNLAAGQPQEITLNGLQPDTRYYYRLRFESDGDTSYEADAEHSFHTPRPPGSTFTFCIHGDSHPERTNNMYDPNFYQLTLGTVATDQPDFYLTIGDDFSVDNIASNEMNQAAVVYRYALQRPYLALVGASAPIFLVNGNHEEASRWAYLNTNLVAAGISTVTYSNIAAWAQIARNQYYPQPAPDSFYSGMTNDVLPGIGQLRSCYAWTWGDALFVTLDPYWYSTNSVDTAYGASTHVSNNKWLVTHGDAQYFWLKQTLEQSSAKYKFVFAHHVMGTGRGGIEEAVEYEWGGQNANGTPGFAANRPNWPDPIHQLMVANNVTAFIQGHDHIFVRQQLDGVTYQELPNPADNRYSLFNADAYTNNVLYLTNNTGYTRFTVSPTGVKVDYVRTILPANLIPAQVGTNGAPPGMTNGQVGYSYTILPLTVSGTANSPGTPTPTDTVWVASSVAGGTNIAQVSLTCIVGGITNTVPMYDDGAHHDGAAGDGVYGAQIPAYPLGTRVLYYVHAVDAATRQFTAPSGAPINTNLYAYVVQAVNTNPPPAVLTGMVFTNGLMQFLILGTTGITQTLQASTNLATWTSVFTTNLSVSPFLWSDSNSPHFTRRYYRVLSQP